jgi:hypothetical protein
MNKEMKVILYTLISLGGVDILGGWKLHTFLLQLAGKHSDDEEMIDTGSKTETRPDFELQQEGMDKLDNLFNGALGLKIPFFWRSIFSN